MKKEIENLRAIVKQYNETVKHYNTETENARKTYSRMEFERIRKEKTNQLEAAVNRLRDEYRKQYEKTINTAKEYEKTSKYIQDTDFQMMLNNLKNIKDTAGIRSMIAPYKNDYHARKLIADTLKQNGRSPEQYGIHTKSLVSELENTATAEALEFTSWKRGNTNCGMPDLDIELERIEDMADGNTAHEAAASNKGWF